MRLRLERAGVRIHEQWLVRGISIEVAPGCLTAVVGPNGSGKSTVLRVLTGLWKPAEGRVTLDGEDLAALPRRTLARRVTFVPQKPRIDVPFTVRDIVKMGRHPHRGRFDAPGPHDREAVEAAMARVDVAQLAERRVNELSGGEFQRVIIARSLATEAEALVLDEPTASLDPDHALGMHELLRDLSVEGKAVALALHDLNAAMRWADNTVLLEGGRLRASGPAGEVLANELLGSVFDVEIERQDSPRGVPTLVFHRRRRQQRGHSAELTPGHFA